MTCLLHPIYTPFNPSALISLDSRSPLKIKNGGNVSPSPLTAAITVCSMIVSRRFHWGKSESKWWNIPLSKIRSVGRAHE